MSKLRPFLLALLLCCSIHSSSQQTMKSLAEKHNKLVGSAASPQVFAEPEFVAFLDREINALWPGNVMKWGVIEATRGKSDYSGGDQLVAHAQAHGMKVRGHTLVWHSQLPSWVEHGNLPAAELKSAIKTHIEAVAGHWKGKIYAWDVVNEVLNEDGSLRNSVFLKTLGKSYIADAFHTAHEVDPAAKLWINDYNCEGVNRKSTGMYNLIKELKAAGVPVHGAGIQGHVGVGGVPHDLEANMRRLTELGIDVAITELDVAIHMPATAASLAQQAKDYAAIFTACLKVERCVGVWIGGLTDKFSWIPGASNHKDGAALIYDEHYKEKPAVAAIKQALSA